MSGVLKVLVVVAALATAEPDAAVECGGRLTAVAGTIQTPGFPRPFNVPISCTWVIDASAQPGPVTIVVYLTQLFVTSGLTFTEYPYYEPEFPFELTPKLIYEVTESNSIKSKWVLGRSSYFVVQFNMDRLIGNHLRVLDDLLDVYGFNITYEMVPEGEQEFSVRNDSCSVVECSLAGNCYVSYDYSTFWCKCFPGFYGVGCRHGPLCQVDSDVCKNGATCRHVGKAAMCQCPRGFTGAHCEISIIGCNSDNCSIQCKYDGSPEDACKCHESYGDRIPPDRWRYEIGLSLAPENVTQVRIQHPGETFFNVLKKQIMRVFKSSSLSRMEGLEILNVTDSGDLLFHFFASEHDKSKVRDARNKLIERGRLGDMTLLPTDKTFLDEPALHLTKIHAPRNSVREGDELILSCAAQGSSFMIFNWFKDGYPIKVSKTNGELWMKLLPKDGSDEYASLLGIEGISYLDEGMYTCQVADWGVQECKSVYIEVLQAPIVQVLPMSASLQKGEDINLKCLSPNEKKWSDQHQTGYSWARDKELFPLSPGQEVWEDLKPAGSILRIQNIQKSTTYTCSAHTSAATKEQSVRIEVVNHTAMAMCTAEDYLGVKWSITAPGSTALSECPQRYLGSAKRQCLTSEPGRAFWQSPDFSNCISDKFDELITDFRILARGYGKTTIEDTMRRLYLFLKGRGKLYPGEGEPVVELLRDLLTYVNRTVSWSDLVSSSPYFFKSVDLLFTYEDSMINEHKVRDLQVLLNRWSLLLAEYMNMTYTHFTHNSFVIDIMNVVNGNHNTYYIPNMSNSYPSWYSARIAIHTDAPESMNPNDSVSVVYLKNITKFLPKRSSQKNLDGTEILYEIQSDIISVSVSSNFKVHVDLEIPVWEMREGWNLTCAVAPSLDSTWDFTTCHYAVKQNYTHCVCQWPGVYSAMLTRLSAGNFNGNNRNWRPSSVVLIGCTCALVQTLITFILLLVRWFHRRTSLLFLKLQCCVTVAATMSVFMYTARITPPTYCYTFLSILIETLMLLSLTAHLSKLLIIYTEVVRLPNVTNIKKTVFGITSGVTLLTVLISLLAHNMIGHELDSWFLPPGSALFYIAMSCGALISSLFIFLFFNLLHRLKFLLRIQDEKNTQIINRRIGLLKRTSFLFVAVIADIFSSILYVNSTNKIYHYAFSILSAFLGFVIFLSYVPLSESSLKIKLFQHLKIQKDKDPEFSSESDNNLFNFFTKQDAEVESDCAPPCVKSVPEIAMTDMSPLSLKMKTKPKMVTFNPTEDARKDVDLEVYPNSPRKFSPGSEFLLNSSENENSNEAETRFDSFPERTDNEEEEGNEVCYVEMRRIDNQLPTIVEDENPDEKDVLDRITHDLDYLLNRTDNGMTYQRHGRNPQEPCSTFVSVPK